MELSLLFVYAQDVLTPKLRKQEFFVRENFSNNVIFSIETILKDSDILFNYRIVAKAINDISPDVMSEINNFVCNCMKLAKS